MKNEVKVPMQPLALALADWADMQAVIGDVVILVRDFSCYQGGGMIVKINGEEDGLNNSYYSTNAIERDLVKVVLGYVVGAPIWQEGEYDY